VQKNKDYSNLVGKIGVTDTELRPAGTVLIENEIYNAETNGEFVPAGRGVRVIRVRKKKITVVLV
jgi:membrane-bound serine protease (ClpP class)